MKFQFDNAYDMHMMYSLTELYKVSPKPIKHGNSNLI
jgi:hypothetical protein